MFWFFVCLFLCLTHRNPRFSGGGFVCFSLYLSACKNVLVLHANPIIHLQLQIYMLEYIYIFICGCDVVLNTFYIRVRLFFIFSHCLRFAFILL